MTMRQLAAAALAAVFSISGLGAILISQQNPGPVDAIELRGDDPAIRRDDDDPARLEVDARDDDDWTNDPSDDVADDTSGADSASIDRPSAGDTSVSVEPAAAPVQNVAPAVNDASVSHDDSVSVDSVSSASND